MPSDKPREAIDPAWAWARYEPDARRPWNLALVGHLHRRAGFGGSWPELEQALGDRPQRAVDRLLQPDAGAAEFNRTYDGYEAAAGDVRNLRAWWLRRMILTPQPLLEKMTLFWHGHFGASNRRVNDPPLMLRHVELLRSEALGSYASMLRGVAQDPAALLTLGADANRKAQPSEGFARELFRRYSLGDGNFTEADVRDAARAMTGWFVFRGQLRYIEREHDAAAKKILGNEGPWDRDDVVRIALAQPATPRLVVGKLYRRLISEIDEPSEELIAPLAESFGRDYDVAALVGTMLGSNLFFSPHSYRRRIKCPVEFAVGIVRGLEGLVSTSQLGDDLAGLGQDLYHPPTVKGWEGGHAWITAATLLGRSNLAASLLGGGAPYGDKLDPRQLAEKHGRQTPEAAARFFVDLFLQGDVASGASETLLETAPPPDPPSGGESAKWLRRVVHGLITLPEFQLA